MAAIHTQRQSGMAGQWRAKVGGSLALCLTGQGESSLSSSTVLVSSMERTRTMKGKKEEKEKTEQKGKGEEKKKGRYGSLVSRAGRTAGGTRGAEHMGLCFPLHDREVNLWTTMQLGAESGGQRAEGRPMAEASTKFRCKVQWRLRGHLRFFSSS